MTTQDPNELSHDSYPRDQLEYYKMELARLRAENDRLTSEVGYLRQALAASLTNIPQIEAPPGSATRMPDPPEAEADPDPSQARRWPWQSDSTSMRTTFGVVSLASLIVSPVAFLALLGLILLCSLIFGGYYVAFGP